MPRTSFNELLDAGVHFGHLKRKWNPSMAPYIFMEKNGIHIIDLHKTAAKLDVAANALKQIAKSGRKILFVATKKQAKELVAERVKKINMPYVKILFLPYMSATLPRGRRNTVAAKRYEVATHASETALIEKSSPIEGSAILMVDPIKGVRKEAIVITMSTVLLLTLLSEAFLMSLVIAHQVLTLRFFVIQIHMNPVSGSYV